MKNPIFQALQAQTYINNKKLLLIDFKTYSNILVIFN